MRILGRLGRQVTLMEGRGEACCFSVQIVGEIAESAVGSYRNALGELPSSGVS
jgi:hypothetical protein